MFYSIENEYLTAQIDDMGAQLHSLVTKDDGSEVLLPALAQKPPCPYFYES